MTSPYAAHAGVQTWVVVPATRVVVPLPGAYPGDGIVGATQPGLAAEPETVPEAVQPLAVAQAAVVFARTFPEMPEPASSWTVPQQGSPEGMVGFRLIDPFEAMSAVMLVTSPVVVMLLTVLRAQTPVVQLPPPDDVAALTTATTVREGPLTGRLPTEMTRREGATLAPPL